MLCGVIALRSEPLAIWNAITLSPRANRTIAPGTCRSCGCVTSRYRQPWEDRCWPCADAERRRREAADALLAAVADVEAVEPPRPAPRERYTGWVGHEQERDEEIRRLLAAGTAQSTIAARLRVYASIRAAR